MASQIAWLDSTPEEQRAARELIALFSDQESRDELGVGQVRDAFSDLLFPGTSVLQTRARYFLFIPWCYLHGSNTHFSGDALRKRADDLQRRLIKTLLDAQLDDASGLIGGRVGPSVKNLPSSAYWSGLRRFSILNHDNELGVLSKGISTADGATEMAQRTLTDWDPGLPPSPTDFPNAAPGGFRLTRPEAEWLLGRMISANPDSALAFLLNQRKTIDDALPRPWDAISRERFEELDHAYWFSKVMNGASLLYNLLVGERYDANPALNRLADVAKTYRIAINEWTSEFLRPQSKDLAHWDVDRMWELALSANPRISPITQNFVNAWIDGVRAAGATSIADDQGLRRLIENRESRKGKQSRLLNEKMLANWSGAAGTGELAYRWGTVRTLVNDVARGLDADAGS